MNKAENIVDIFVQNPNLSQKKIAKLTDSSLKTVNRAITNYKSNISNAKKPKSGRTKGFVDKKLESKVVNKILKKRDDSVRDLAQKCGTSKSTVHRIKAGNEIETFVKQNIPKKTTKQFNEGVDRAKNFKKFLRGKKNHCMIMDDESYVKLDFSTLPGKQYYMKKRGEVLSDSITKFTSEKFPAKRMVWQAICECGKRSRPFFVNGTMDSEMYISKCLHERLLPFIKEHNVPCIFWPDLAPIHYSRAAVQWFEDNDVLLVPKTANPAAVPEDRPIERYWALCKRELKKEPKAAKTDKDFRYRWKRASSRVSLETIKSMMASVRDKIKSRSQLTKIEE